jgi:hypothetical protein
MTRRITAVVAALAAAALGAPTADAAFLPVDVADGPSPDIVALGGADLSADGTGGLAYLKREGGTAHVFASTLVLGRPTPAVRVDVGRDAEATDLRFASANEYGGVAVWLNGGELWGARRPLGDSAAWEPPQRIFADTVLPVRDPQLDVTLLGTAIVSFNVGGDVRVARLPWDGNDWRVLPPVDIDPNALASDADVGASADGSALVAWSEIGAGGVSHVWARRVTDDGDLSVNPREASIANIEGRPGGSADSPSVDVQDDSSYVFVAWRQDFIDGAAVTSRALARRLVASTFEPAQFIDGLGFPTADGAAGPHVDSSGRGRGIDVTPTRSGAAMGARIARKEPLGATFRQPVRLDIGGNATGPPVMTSTMSEGEEGVAAWHQAPTGQFMTVRARHWDDGQFKPELTLSPPEFGPSEPQLGFFSGSDSRLDSILAWVQGGEGNRRIVVSAYDGPLRPAAIPNDPNWRRKRRPKLDWNPLTNVLWGPVRYSVEIDGLRVALTSRSAWRPRKPLPDGAHNVRITQIDGRGQESPGLDRPLWIDTTAPKIRFRKGRLYVNDGTPLQGSGVATVRVVHGRRARSIRVPAIGRVRGARVGRRPTRIIATDKIGNRRSVSGRTAAR